MRRTWMLMSVLLIVLLVAGCRPVQRPADAGAADEVLPFDPDVRTGQLANGLTYYIRQNAEPPQRAELWLAVNAGSALEEEDQKGLAHFLEHMLFNGTENYPSMDKYSLVTVFTPVH